jgi:hypothetical protein
MAIILYSQGYLAMQKRRRKQIPPASAPNRERVNVAPDYWDELQQRDINILCNLTLFTPVSPQQLSFLFLNEEVLVDLSDRCLKRSGGSGWQKTDDPLLELATVLYLINVKEVYPLGKDIVGTKDLKEANFFQGPHALKVEALIKRYGYDINGFKAAAVFLRGEALDMADSAYKFLPFPRIPLYYLLWEGDEEFKPRINVLFDRSIENIFAADAIWALVNRVSVALIEGPTAIETNP